MPEGNLCAEPDAASRSTITPPLATGDAGLLPSVCGAAPACEAVADFSGVWGSARDDVWVIGSLAGAEPPEGVVLHWDGQRWARQPALVREPAAIHGAAQNDIWIVGRGGQVARFDGVSWRLREDVPSRVDLAAVWSSAAGSAWVAGAAGTLWLWTGDAWQDHSLPASGGLGAVLGRAPDDVWVAGEAGRLWHWDGLAWRVDESLSSAEVNLQGLSVDEAGTWWVVGDARVARRAAEQWSPFETVPIALPRDAWRAVVASAAQIWIASTEGQLAGIFNTEWGWSWTGLDAGAPLQAVWRATTGELYAVGRGDAVLFGSQGRWWRSAAMAGDGPL